jgi:predicted Zn-dependent protease
LLEYHNVKSEATLMPESSPEHQLVARVGRRIAAATLLNTDGGGGSSRTVQWEFHCEDTEEVNAFVLPGGKVFVCRGLLEVCKTDDELAVVVAHEAAHVQARHVAERLSMSRFPSVLKTTLMLLAAAGAVPFDAASEVMMFTKMGGVDLAAFMLLSLPYSRTHEKEADVLGMDIMVRACVDPLIATKVWEKMAKRHAHQDTRRSEGTQTEKQRGQVPTILSTHPHDETRASYLGELAPEKAVAYHAAGCGHVSEQVLRMGRRALQEKRAAARNAQLQTKE